jgi:hypothetical protein
MVMMGNHAGGGLLGWRAHGKVAPVQANATSAPG